MYITDQKVQIKVLSVVHRETTNYREPNSPIKLLEINQIFVWYTFWLMPPGTNFSLFRWNRKSQRCHGQSHFNKHLIQVGSVFDEITSTPCTASDGKIHLFDCKPISVSQIHLTLCHWLEKSGTLYLKGGRYHCIKYF